MTGLDRPPRPLRYSPALLHLRFVLLSIALVLVLVVAGVAVFVNQSATHGKSALVATKTLVPTLTTIHTPARTPTPTSMPLAAATPTPIPPATAAPTPMPPPTMQMYEAESPSNTLIGNTSVISVVSCSACSGGEKVWYIGNGNALQFNMINITVRGNYQLILYYCTQGDRIGYVSVDNNPGIEMHFASTGSFNIVGSQSVVVTLNVGDNTIKFYNDSGFAPDLDKIVISA